MGTHTISTLRQRFWLRAVLAALLGSGPALAQPQPLGYLATPRPAEPVPIAASTSVPPSRVRAVAPAPPVWVVQSTPSAAEAKPKPRGLITALRGLFGGQQAAPAPAERRPATGVPNYRTAPVAATPTLPPLTPYGHLSAYRPASAATSSGYAPARTSYSPAPTSRVSAYTPAATWPAGGVMPVLPTLPQQPTIQGWSGWGVANPTPAMQSLSAQGVRTPEMPATPASPSLPVTQEVTETPEVPIIAPLPRPVPVSPALIEPPAPPMVPAQPVATPPRNLPEPRVMPHAQPTGATGPVLPPSGLVPASASTGQPVAQPHPQAMPTPPVRRSATGPSGTAPKYGWYGYGAPRRPSPTAPSPVQPATSIQPVRATYSVPAAHQAAPPAAMAQPPVSAAPVHLPPGRPISSIGSPQPQAVATVRGHAPTPSSEGTTDVSTLIRQYLTWASQGQASAVDVVAQGQDEVTVRFRVRKPAEAEPLVNGLSALPQLRNYRVHFEVGVGS